MVRGHEVRFLLPAALGPYCDLTFAPPFLVREFGYTMPLNGSGGDGALSLKIYETIIILKYGKILGFADWRITQ